MSQTERLIRYVRAHPGCSGLEIIAALHLPKYTSRISDARAAGVEIECFRRGDGIRGYRVVEKPVQQAMFG
jgi:hypothetical protein